jgi:hypothetical protein
LIFDIFGSKKTTQNGYNVKEKTICGGGVFNFSQKQYAKRFRTLVLKTDQLME